MFPPPPPSGSVAHGLMFILAEENVLQWQQPGYGAREENDNNHNREVKEKMGRFGMRCWKFYASSAA